MIARAAMGPSDPTSAGVRAAPVRRSPVLVAIDDEPAALARIEHELHRRYGSDYRVVGERSADRALDRLAEMRVDGDEVAVVLADQWMPGLTGTEVLRRVRELHPQAKRGLLIDFGAWGDPATADAVLRAMAMGQIDYYVLKPWRSPDELFHRSVAEFVHEWARAAGSGPREIMVVGPARPAAVARAAQPARPQRRAPHRLAV